MELLVVVLLAVVIVLLVVLVANGRSSQTAVNTEDQQLAAYGQAAQQALSTQSQQFLQLAETRYGALSQHTTVTLDQHSQRIGDALDALGNRLASLERERNESTTSLTSMVRELTVASQAARTETAQLRTALRDSRVRGTWGEVQLRRVFELSGLGRHVDFAEQHTAVSEEGTVRPDAVVYLPNDRVIVVDAKAPLDRFLDASANDDPGEQQRLLEAHARAVSAHVSALANRRYHERIQGAVDMVVLFLPGEPFLAAALDGDPGLFDSAAKRGVVLCSPSSLLPLLRGVSMGWRERQASDEAAEIQRLGTELHERVGVFLDSYTTVGAKLAQATEAYNRSIGSMESRLLVSARRLAERGAGSARQLDTPDQILTAVRVPQPSSALTTSAALGAPTEAASGE